MARPSREVRKAKMEQIHKEIDAAETMQDLVPLFRSHIGVLLDELDDRSMLVFIELVTPILTALRNAQGAADTLEQEEANRAQDRKD